MKLQPHAMIVVTALVAACGGDVTGYSGGGNNNNPPPPSNTVRAVSSLQFTPSSITVAAGSTVTFAFESVAHDVFFDNAPAGAPANISTPTANTSVTRTFPTPGRYVYNCHIHPGMSGVVIVQ
jgi:plastocyanin